MRWRRSRCSIRCPVHALDFHHFGKPREGKVRFVHVLQSPPLPLPLKSRVCRCLQSVPSPWKYHHLWPRVEPILRHWHRWAVKRQSERFQGWNLRTTSISQWIWLIPGSRWTSHEQAWTKSTSPKSTETQSRRKRFRCPNGANRRASGAKTATTTANGANRLASACSVAGAKSATPTACVTSAEMALGLRQTSHSAGHWRFLPPFFFCGCWCKLFFQRPLPYSRFVSSRSTIDSSVLPSEVFPRSNYPGNIVRFCNLHKSTDDATVFTKVLPKWPTDMHGRMQHSRRLYTGQYRAAILRTTEMLHVLTAAAGRMDVTAVQISTDSRVDRTQQSANRTKKKKEKKKKKRRQLASGQIYRYTRRAFLLVLLQSKHSMLSSFGRLWPPFLRDRSYLIEGDFRSGIYPRKQEKMVQSVRPRESWGAEPCERIMGRHWYKRLFFY